MITAVTLNRVRPTRSRPIEVGCDDARAYIVKGVRRDQPEDGVNLVAEQVVHALGVLIGAPVGEAAVIQIPPEMAERHEASYLCPGPAHGSVVIPGLSDARADTLDVELNRPRFAAMTVLWAWTRACDLQFFYDPAGLVYSLDHSNYLRPSGARARLKGWLIERCQLGGGDLAGPLTRLERLTADQVRDACEAPPACWGGDRREIAEMLCRRREELLSAPERRPTTFYWPSPFSTPGIRSS